MGGDDFIPVRLPNDPCDWIQRLVRPRQRLHGGRGRVQFSEAFLSTGVEVKVTKDAVVSPTQKPPRTLRVPQHRNRPTVHPPHLVPRRAAAPAVPHADGAIRPAGGKVVSSSGQYEAARPAAVPFQGLYESVLDTQVVNTGDAARVAGGSGQQDPAPPGRNSLLR
eukprot:gene87-biopygen51